MQRNRPTRRRFPGGRRSRPINQRGRHAAGFSLLEGLISMAILLFLAGSLLPLFTTAGKSNADGHDSSVAASEARSAIDSLLVRTFDDPSFDLVAPLTGYQVRASTSGTGGEELVMPGAVWDTGAKAPLHTPPRLGDAGWAPAPSGDGLVLWRRETVVRDYAYADIAGGVIDVVGGATLSTLGHPELFDSPLDRGQSASLRQLKENDLQLVSQRAGGEDDSSSDWIGVNRLRTRFFRTY